MTYTLRTCILTPPPDCASKERRARNVREYIIHVSPLILIKAMCIEPYAALVSIRAAPEVLSGAFGRSIMYMYFALCSLDHNRRLYPNIATPIPHTKGERLNCRFPTIARS